ncbi:MAG TPA: hypothetical protein VFS21_26480 [Roseiflexaceae bacterium]|nr:hypothetical protein [Roseiflexaceae bacterium]
MSSLPIAPAPCPLCGRADRVSHIATLVAGGTSFNALVPGLSPQQQGELIARLARTYPRRAPDGLAHGRLPWSAVLLIGLPGPLCCWGWLLVQALVARSQGGPLDLRLWWCGPALFALLTCGAAFENLRVAWQLRPQLRRARQRWQALCYCHRDDVAFLPGDPRGLPPERSDLLLFDFPAQETAR